MKSLWCEELYDESTRLPSMHEVSCAGNAQACMGSQNKSKIPSSAKTVLKWDLVKRDWVIRQNAIRWNGIRQNKIHYSRWMFHKYGIHASKWKSFPAHDDSEIVILAIFWDDKQKFHAWQEYRSWQRSRHGKIKNFSISILYTNTME